MLDIDPMDLRIKNATVGGNDKLQGGGKYDDIGNLETMLAMKNHPHYKAELQGPNKGRGVSMGFWGNAGLETSSSASVNPDGSVNFVIGSVDIGGSRASLSMMLAETLGITSEEVHPKIVDTDGVGFTMFTAGSRTTFAGGWAAYELGRRSAADGRSRRPHLGGRREGRVYGTMRHVRGPKDAEGKTAR